MPGGTCPRAYQLATPLCDSTRELLRTAEQHRPTLSIHHQRYSNLSKLLPKSWPVTKAFVTQYYRHTYNKHYGRFVYNMCNIDSLAK